MKMQGTIMVALMLLGIPTQNFGQKLTSITNELPLIWKAKTGNTTFKTNVEFTSDYLIIGSNGEHYRDYYMDDNFGVKVVNRKSGKIIRTIAGEGYGDMDVNGVLFHDNRLYFGNDNEEFLCTDLEGNIIFRKDVSGDVEHKPQLIKVDDKYIIVYATELGEIRAIDPLKGNTVWKYYDEDFEGWKAEDNRNLFKVKAYFSSGMFFTTPPVLHDINKDGVLDLVYNQYYSSIKTIINGRTGQLISNKHYTGVASWGYTPYFHEARKVFYQLENVNDDSYAAKKILKTYSVNGKALNSHFIGEISTGLNSLDLDSKFIIPTADSLIVIENERLSYIPISFGKMVTNIDLLGNTYQQFMSNNSWDVLISNRSFQYGKYGECVLVVSQRNNLGYYDKTIDRDKGSLIIVSLDQKRAIKHLCLPGTSEFRPFISDSNKDGKLDVLISCRDQYLYCFDLGVEDDNYKQTASK